MCPHARTPSPVQVSARTIKPKEKDFDPKKRIVGIPVRRTLPRPFRDPSETRRETLPRPFHDTPETRSRRDRLRDASRCLQMPPDARSLSLNPRKDLPPASPTPASPARATYLAGLQHLRHAEQQERKLHRELLRQLDASPPSSPTRVLLCSRRLYASSLPTGRLPLWRTCDGVWTRRRGRTSSTPQPLVVPPPRFPHMYMWSHVISRRPPPRSRDT